MRILLIAHYNIYSNTPRAFRTLELANELVERGYNVDILIGSEKRVLHDYYKGINIINKNIIVKKEKKFKKIRKCGSFILNYLYGDMVIVKFYKSSMKLISDETNDYSAVISIGLPFYTHMILKHKKLENCIKICDCGDPFYVDSKKQAFYWSYIQKQVFKNAKYVCLPTEMAINYYTKYVDINKIKIIPQGINFNDFKIPLYVKNNVPTFGYAGIFYEKLRDPSNFIKYLERLDRQFKFILYTDIHNLFFKKAIKPHLTSLGNKVEIHDFIPRKDCVKMLSTFDFLINFENISNVQSPSKLIDYGISNRPILSFSSNSFDSDVFLKFLSGDYTSKLILDISPFDTKNVTDKFEKLFNCEEILDLEKNC